MNLPPIMEVARGEHDTDRFADLFYVLRASYDKKRGRVLDPEQVQILVEAFANIADMNQALTDENQQLRRELDNAD